MKTRLTAKAASFGPEPAGLHGFCKFVGQLEGLNQEGAYDGGKMIGFMGISAFFPFKGQRAAFIRSIVV